MPRPAKQKPPAVNVPAITGIKDPATRWQSVASTLTPSRAASVIRQAREGNADAYLTLAEEIEERDLHFSSVLNTRKLAVCGVEPEVIPGDVRAVTVRGTKPRAQEKLAVRVAEDFAEQVVEEEWFSDALYDMMDALNKGYSVMQPLWDTSESQWNYSGFTWWDPRLFQFDRATLRELRYKVEGSIDGRAIPEGSLIVHYPKIKTGVRIRGGLAMLATIAHVAKSFTLADWLAFAEVYGMPLRVAKYDPEVMGQPEIDRLKIALANIGHDAAALIPNGSSIEILDGRRPPSGTNVFGDLADYWDRALSKAVLGQTMTVDDGSSKSQAQVHNDVRLDLRRADARALCATVRGQIIKPWVLYNYGPEAPVPRLSLGVDPPEDLKAFSDALNPFIANGLRVKASDIYARFSLNTPDGDDEAVLEGPMQLDMGEDDEEQGLPTRKLAKKKPTGTRARAAA